MSIMNINNCPSLVTNESYFCAFKFQVFMKHGRRDFQDNSIKKNKQNKLLTVSWDSKIFAFRDNLALDPLDSKLNTVGYAYLALCVCLPLFCL